MLKYKKSLALIIMSTLVLASIMVGCKKAAPAVTPVENPYKDAVKLTWYFVGDKQPDAQKVYDKFNEILAKKINTTVDFQISDWGSYDEKMKLRTASQEEFDVCFTANWSNNFYQNVAKGAFVDMYPLISKYAPALKKALPEVVFKAGEIDGKLYGLSNYQMIFDQAAFFMPKAIADKYGITSDKIKTYSDIEQFLPAVKAGEPKLYTIRPSYESFQTFQETIGGSGTYINPSETGFKVFGIGDGTAVKDQPDVKFQLMAREWLRKGYMRKDIATVKDDTADLNALKYAIWSGPFSPGGEAAAKVKFKTDIVSFPFTKPYIKMKAGDATLNAISQTSKYPDRAIKVMELLNTDKDLYNLLCYGIEGEHYTKTDNNVEIVKDSKYNQGLNWEFGNTFNAFPLKGTNPEVSKQIADLNTNATKSKLMGFVPNLDNIKTQISQVDAAGKEFWRREYLDVNDDAKFLAMKQEQTDKMLKAGAADILKEIQKQVDAYVKANNLK